MRRRDLRLDLLLVGLWVVCTCATLPLQDTAPAFVRSITGLLMIGSLLYATYRMLTALFAEHFDAAFRVALTIGLFIGVTLCLGIVLNFTPWGITRPMWMLGFGLVTMVMLLVTMVAERHWQPPATVWRISPARLMALVLVAGMFLGAYGVARVGLEQQASPSFTELWLSADETIPQDTLEIGLISHEHQTMTYRLELGGADDSLIQTWENITIAPGTTWQSSIALSSTNTVYPVVGRLYRAGDIQPYRRVDYWSQDTRNK